MPRGVMVDGSVIALGTARHGNGIIWQRRPFIDPNLRSGKLVKVFEAPLALSATYDLRHF